MSASRRTPAESQTQVGDTFYESNNYVGLSADFKHHLVFGVTFTDFTTPGGLSSSSREVAFSARYAASWHPQFTAVVPTDSGIGVYTVADIKPILKILKNTGHVASGVDHSGLTVVSREYKFSITSRRGGAPQIRSNTDFFDGAASVLISSRLLISRPLIP